MRALDPAPSPAQADVHRLRAEGYRKLAEAEALAARLAATPVEAPTAPAEWVTVKAAADRLAVSTAQVYEMALRGALQSIKIGRARRIQAASIDRYARQHAAEAR